MAYQTKNNTVQKFCNKKPITISQNLMNFSTSLKKTFLALTLIFSLIGVAAHGQWKNPTDAWKTIGPPKGTLMIVGGSAVPSIYNDFVKLVGDPKALIVFIPTAGNVVDENNTAYTKLVEAGAKNIVVLHTKNREEANSEEFIAPLRKAKGVFIGGGFQNRLARAYLHTLTHQAMFEVLARGGIVAGSSAGASIQGSYLYGGGDEKEGFGFVKESAIGQHYVRRNRMGSVARILKNDTKLFGIGIDEATAIVVKGNEFEVIGDSKVAIYDPSLPGWPAPKAQYYLFPGDKFDMASRKTIYEAVPSPKDLWADANKRWKIPSTNWQTVGPPTGKLILYGAEKTVDETFKHFLKSTETTNSSIVVLSTGNAEAKAKSEEVVNSLKKMGANNVSLIHTINSNQANSHSFAATLKNATAVWICDGEKWQFADTYLNTLLHKELFEVLKRNGTIAGTGAGAAMMASRLFGERYNWNKGYGFTRQTMIFEEPLGRNPLKNVKELQAKDSNLLGIGIEKGAIVTIEKNQATISGNGNIKLYKASEAKPIVLSPGKTYSFND